MRRCFNFYWLHSKLRRLLPNCSLSNLFSVFIFLNLEFLIKIQSAVLYISTFLFPPHRCPLFYWPNYLSIYSPRSLSVCHFITFVSLFLPNFAIFERKRFCLFFENHFTILFVRFSPLTLFLCSKCRVKVVMLLHPSNKFRINIMPEQWPVL